MVVGGTLLAAAVLHVKSEQAGEARAISTSCQEGAYRLFEDGHRATSGDLAQAGLECAHWIQISP